MNLFAICVIPLIIILILLGALGVFTIFLIINEEFYKTYDRYIINFRKKDKNE